MVILMPSLRMRYCKDSKSQLIIDVDFQAGELAHSATKAIKTEAQTQDRGEKLWNKVEVESIILPYVL